MDYFVYAPSGQKYGPADFPTLLQWVQEARIEPTTKLEEVGTGHIIYAKQLAGLGFPAPGNYYQGVQPSPQSYPKIVETKGDKLASTAKALGYSGFFLCPLICLIGMGFAAMAMTYQSPNAKSAMMVCVGAMLLQGLLLGLCYGLFKSGLSSLSINH